MTKRTKYLNFIVECFKEHILAHREAFKRYCFSNNDYKPFLKNFFDKIKEKGLTFSSPYHEHDIGNNNEYRIFLKEKDKDGFILEKNMQINEQQKNELIELYWDDFYAMNIIDWFSEFYPKETKKALLKTLKYMGISYKNWNNICKAKNNFEFWASEQYDDIVLNTMWTLLENANVDPHNA